MTGATIAPKHQRHLADELGEGGLELAIACGVRSITEAEATEMGFRLQGQSSSGLLFPFGQTFSQLRCDTPPVDADGEPAKYLSPAGSRQDVAIIGTGGATIATEGWKDGAALHLASGEAVAAIAGVHTWHLLPESVRLLIYDADAARNPHVWGPLLLAGAARPHLRLAFFDAAIAGPKGGACEYFRSGGTLEAIERLKPRALLDRIADGLSSKLRVDWHGPSITALVRAAVALGLSEPARAALLKRAYGRLRMEKALAKRIEAAALEAIAREKAEAAGLDYDAVKAAAEEAQEPTTTHERNRRLLAAIGHEWQADYDDRQGWRRWTGTHWSEVRGDDAVLGEIERFFDAHGWQDRERSTVLSLVAAFRRSISSVPHAPVPGLLPFRNGCLELATGALLPHDPAHGNAWCLPYDYDPAAACPGIEAFLLDRLEDPASVAVFRAFAWHLLNGRRPKAFLEIVGDAETGKSVLATLLTALVGRETSEAGTLERLEDRSQRFETIRFRGKRLAIFNECQRYSGPLEMLKTFTGGDAIAAERKGSSAAVSFVFHGGVVLVGNGSVRPSDASGAVINRRRSLFVRKVISSADARVMLEADGHGWRGELARELPGFARWVLGMTEGEARAALARDVASRARAEAKLEALLETDHLAAWADECLVWDPEAEPARIGSIAEPTGQFLLPNYRKWVEDREGRGAHGQKQFKHKLLTLLRTLGLPMPPGSGRDGDYKVRGLGSVMPCVRFRDARDPEDRPGVITYAVMAEAMGNPSAERVEEAPERIGNDKNPLGNGWNGWNGSEQIEQIKSPSVSDGRGEREGERDTDAIESVDASRSVPAVPSVPHKGFQRSAAVPPPPLPVPDCVPDPSPSSLAGVPVLVDGCPGWRLPGAMPRGNGPTVPVLLIAPDGSSRRVERRRISLPANANAA